MFEKNWIKATSSTEGCVLVVHAFDSKLDACVEWNIKVIAECMDFFSNKRVKMNIQKIIYN